MGVSDLPSLCGLYSLFAAIHHNSYDTGMTLQISTVLMYRVRVIGNSSSLSGRRFFSPVFVMFVFASESVTTLSSGVTAIQAKEN